MKSVLPQNKLNIGETEFFIVTSEFRNENMPFQMFNVVQTEDYITRISYDQGWGGIMEIFYHLSNGDNVSDHEAFRTKEEALARAMALNKQVVYNNLSNLKLATNFLTERKLLDLDDRFVGFLMEINARFNAFEKTQYPTEGEE